MRQPSDRLVYAVTGALLLGCLIACVSLWLHRNGATLPGQLQNPMFYRDLLHTLCLPIILAGWACAVSGLNSGYLRRSAACALVALWPVAVFGTMWLTR